MSSDNDRRAHGRVLYTRADLRRYGILVSNSTLLRLEAAGNFPARIRLSGHSVAWIRDEIDAHIAALADRRECRR